MKVKVVLLVLLLLMHVSDYTVSGGTQGTRGEIGGYMSGELIYKANRSLSGGIGGADLDSDGAKEICFCDFQGNMVLLDRTQDGGFRAGKIWEESGEPGSSKGLFDLVITDALLSEEGPEILTGGYSGQLYALYRTEDGWDSKVIQTSPFRIFEIELGDIDPAPGEEVLYGSMQNDQADPDRFLRYVRRTSGDTFEQVEIPVPEAVKAIEVADADPDVPGPEIWITTSAWNDKGGTLSTLVELWKDGEGWTDRVLFTDPDNLITNVRVGELWAGHDGNEMLLTTLSGWCHLAYFEGSEFRTEPVFQARTETGSNFGLEGMALGDINPNHPGDEAMVTGYYNRVYQIVEASGEVVADLAWTSEAKDVKLELSGVEIVDVSDSLPGNECLVASLQGWVQMLHYEQDGIGISIPEIRYSLAEGGEVMVPVRIIPSGLLSGPLVIGTDAPPSIAVIVPSGLTIESHDALDLTLVVEAVSLLKEGDLDIMVSATVGEHSASGRIRLSLEGSSTSVVLFVEPVSGTVYDIPGSHLRVRVGILGGDDLDRLDLEVSEAEGLFLSVNTPIVPGEYEYLTVLPLNGVASGKRIVTLSALYNGMLLAQTEVEVEVRHLADDLGLDLIRSAKNEYLARLEYNGTAHIEHLSVTFMYGSETISTLSDVNLTPSSNISALVRLKEGDKGMLTVFVDDLTQEEVETFNVGPLVHEGGVEEDEEFRPYWVIVGFLVVSIAVVLFVMLMIYTRGTPDSDARIDRIGGYRGRPGGPAPPGRRSYSGRQVRTDPGRDRYRNRSPAFPPQSRGPNRR